MSQQVRTAVLRPNDDRVERAVELFDSLGATLIPDPMLAAEPTGATSRLGAFVVPTSETGVEFLDEAGWNPSDAALCCIGLTTIDAVHDAGWAVGHVPDEYTSAGLVDHLAPNVDGTTIEVAWSDHGSAVLTDGLYDAGVDVHETMLCRLVHPEGVGESTELVTAGDLEVTLFTSSLTVEHFLDATVERGTREEAITDLNGAVVGAIGPPTHDTAESHGIDMMVVPDRATFEALAIVTAETTAPAYHRWRDRKRSGRGSESRDER